MPLPALIAAVAAGLVIVVALALVVERARRNRRFARKLSPYERRRGPGGQVVDAEEWVRGR